LNSTTFVRVIFRYHLYLRSYLRGWIKMAHPVYHNHWYFHTSATFYVWNTVLYCQ